MQRGLMGWASVTTRARCSLLNLCRTVECTPTFDAPAAAAIEADAAAAESLVAEWGSPFCDGWERFRPDPAWPIPGQPE